MGGPFRLVGVTVSLEVSDASYGNGSKRFASFKAETPAESPATLDEGLAASLDLHLAAFESVYAAIVAGGGIKVDEYNQIRTQFKNRRASIAAIFAKHPINPQEDSQ